MSNYLKSEFYRIFRYKGSYLFVVICSALLIASNVVLAFVNKAEINFPYATTKFSLSNLYSSFIVIYLLCISVASMIFGKEYSNHTMKNSVSYGISRETIFFGKLIVEIIYAIIAFAIITGLHVLSAYLLLENSGSEHLMLLLKTVWVSFPQLLYALAVTNSMLFIFEGTGAALTAVVAVLIAFPTVCSYLGMKFMLFRNLSKILPWVMLNNMAQDTENMKLYLLWEGNQGYYNYWIFGILNMIVITLIGYVIFRKKEIK